MRPIDADVLLDNIRHDSKKAIDEGDKAGSFWLGYAAGSVIAQPTIQPELTDEQAIVHLQSSGWMYRHDKEIYESGLKEQLADDSDSYDSLLPTIHPELDLETLIRTIETGITATNSNDAYSLGMRNGMRWCKSLIDGVEPKFEDAADSAESPSAHPERADGHWIPHETPDGGVQYECSECGVLWEFNDGTPEDNEAYYCPKCGVKMEGATT